MQTKTPILEVLHHALTVEALKTKKLIVFDLDGTLAESKSSLDAGMSSLLGELLGVAKVAIISGGDWLQFERQVVSHLPETDCLTNLSILPTSGTKFYHYEAGWKELYAENLTEEEREDILCSLEEAIDEADLGNAKTWGPRIQDRGSQITYSALGQQAPLEEKKKWDPHFDKRKRLKAILDPLLPGFSVRLGGTTSVDITRPGVDKAYGIKKLQETLGVGIEEMLFVGDALFPGGNDYPAKEAGVVSIPVKGPSETKKIIEAIIACLGGGHQAPSVSVQ
jgi:HAD superfamily hydrolase (TIGR01484 family)